MKAPSSSHKCSYFCKLTFDFKRENKREYKATSPHSRFKCKHYCNRSAKAVCVCIVTIHVRYHRDYIAKHKRMYLSIQT